MCVVALIDAYAVVTETAKPPLIGSLLLCARTRVSHKQFYVQKDGARGYPE